MQPIVFLSVFLRRSATQAWHDYCVPSGSLPRAENIMKLQLGQKQLILEFSKSPFAWFQGRTERMRLTSLSLLFVRFSVFARQPAA